MMPCERKSVKPMAAMTAPERRSACSFGDRIVGRRFQSSDRLLKFGEALAALFGFVADAATEDFYLGLDDSRAGHPPE